MPSLRGSRTKSFENGTMTMRDEHGVMVPSRTSSLHSRIAQPLPTALSMRTGQRAPKTLTHAYMVCGVGREPSQWMRAPAPAQGKIAHMKGAVGTFWLPEILGSSPRLEQDNEIARSLHAAMRVSPAPAFESHHLIQFSRPASLTMSKYAPARASRTAYTTPSSSNKTPPTLSTASPYGYGPGPTRSVQKLSANCARGRSPTTMTPPMRRTGSHTV